MMIKSVNRWAIEDYLCKIADQVSRPVFKKVSETLKKNERPKLNDVEEFFLKKVENAADEYLMLQDLAFRLDDHLKKLEVNEDRRAAIIGAAMYDGTQRDLEWERQHNAPAGRYIHYRGNIVVDAR